MGAAHEEQEPKRPDEGREQGQTSSLRMAFRRLTVERQRLHGQYADCKTDLHIADVHPELYSKDELDALLTQAGNILTALRAAECAEEAFVQAHPEVMQSNGRATEEEYDPRPRIPITADLHSMANAAEAALMTLPGPILFQRVRQLCRIAPAGPSPVWLQRPPDTPVIVPVPTPALREYSNQCMHWTKYNKRTKEDVPALPPAFVFDALANRVAWKFPYLERLSCAPTIRPDGVLVDTPGFDGETGIFLDFNGTAFLPVSQTPSLAEAEQAIALLKEPFSDFPFAEECHRSAAIAAILTVIGRFAIPGNVPLFAVRAHSRGTGKGLLVDVIATIATGRTAPTWSHTTDTDEDKKSLFSLALAGDAVVHIDNVIHALGNEHLDSALTTSTIKSRMLGTNTVQEAPWTAVLFASGNNMVFTGDTVRRVVPIDLDPKSEHPEERSDFTHTRLKEWVREQRPQLVHAALTVLKAFFVAGRPKEPEIPEYGSFEQWADLIRHGLLWAGLPDPCGGRTHLEAESDTSYETHATLLHCWGVCYPKGEARTLKVVTQDAFTRRNLEPKEQDPANQWNDLFDALAAYDEKFDGKRLDNKRIGTALRKIEGRVLSGVRLIRNGEYNRAILWKREVIT